MRLNMKFVGIGSTLCLLGIAGVSSQSSASVAVDVSTPNVRVQVGSPAPPPHITVVEHERVIIKEKRDHDNGKHKGHYKKHKKHKSHKKH